MKSAEQYLDEVRVRLDLPSDYAVAKALDITRAAVSKYRCGRTLPDDLVCARIADALHCEPMEVIAAMHYQRAKSDDERALWESIWGKAAGAFALSLPASGVGKSGAPTTKGPGSGSGGKKGDVPSFVLCQMRDASNDARIRRAA